MGQDCPLALSPAFTQGAVQPGLGRNVRVSGVTTGVGEEAVLQNKTFTLAEAFTSVESTTLGTEGVVMGYTKE